jgi:tetratricopeptide (TPR) repeat protein
MKMKVSIKSPRGKEFATKVEVDGKVYIVQTEDLGKKSRKISTSFYLDGAVVKSLSTDYSDVADEPDVRERLKAMIACQHEAAIESLSPKMATEKKPIIEYVRELNGLLKRRDSKSALNTVKQAVADYPSDPFFLSYLGYLTAQVERRSKEGCTFCKNAISLMRRAVSEDKEFFYPILYLNLGRAYVLGGKKPEAIKAFQDGLRYDTRNENIRSELSRLGIRRPPVLPFLDRSNPINKYLGKLRHKLTGRSTPGPH